MSTYDQKRDDEANWQGWALPLPREGLLACWRRGLTVGEIAQQYKVTETLVNFRVRMTGVEAHSKAAAYYRRK